MYRIPDPDLRQSAHASTSMSRAERSSLRSRSRTVHPPAPHQLLNGHCPPRPTIRPRLATSHCAAASPSGPCIAYQDCRTWPSPSHEPTSRQTPRKSASRLQATDHITGAPGQGGGEGSCAQKKGGNALLQSQPGHAPGTCRTALSRSLFAHALHWRGTVCCELFRCGKCGCPCGAGSLSRALTRTAFMRGEFCLCGCRKHFGWPPGGRRLTSGQALVRPAGGRRSRPVCRGACHQTRFAGSR